MVVSAYLVTAVNVPQSFAILSWQASHIASDRNDSVLEIAVLDVAETN